MKISGYARKPHSNDLLVMKEVTMSGTPSTLRIIAKFLAEAADRIERKPQLFDHIHINESHSEWPDKWPDIIAAPLRDPPPR